MLRSLNFQPSELGRKNTSYTSTIHARFQGSFTHGTLPKSKMVLEGEQQRGSVEDRNDQHPSFFVPDYIYYFSPKKEAFFVCTEFAHDHYVSVK